MTQAKAAAITSALITAGYLPTVAVAQGVYEVRARTIDGALVPVNTIKSFADAQGVTSYTDQGVFS